MEKKGQHAQKIYESKQNQKNVQTHVQNKNIIHKHKKMNILHNCKRTTVSDISVVAQCIHHKNIFNILYIFNPHFTLTIYLILILLRYILFLHFIFCNLLPCLRECNLSIS
eukprot:866634_1